MTHSAAWGRPAACRGGVMEGWRLVAVLALLAVAVSSGGGACGGEGEPAPAADGAVTDDGL